MKFKYRPEIDGLRAIAVIAVILFHANIYSGAELLFKGGFFGVDVFFVISGFLITSLIIAELDQSGRLSILNFYERRVRRIIPMLLCVILVSIPFALNYLSPIQMIDYSKSILASLVFESNYYWHFAFQVNGAESSNIRAFVHTWSLSIEEQFYLFFPVIIMMIHRWTKSHRLLVFSLLTVFSLAFAQWLTMRDASLSFHILPSRFWEFTAGAILAHTLYLNPQRRTSILYKSLPFIGICLILYSIILIPFRFGEHPGYITLIPVVGTIFVIGFAHDKDLVTRILSHKSLTGIGLISYSLYLWHHPIFAFGFLTQAHPSLVDKTIWILISLLLSILSYYFVERPFRSTNTISRKRLFVSIATAITLIGSFALFHSV